MKLGDGLFLETCREIAKRYPQLEYNEQNVDTMCMHLAMDPSRADLMIMPNLYGDIVSDLAAGLIGGLGLTPSGNIGEEAAVFEAVHGTAPDIAGLNKANPTALLLSAVMMLNHMGLSSKASNIQQAVFKTLRQGDNLTGDLGGNGSTTGFTEAIIKNL